ncbi:hypothetical protein AC482_05260 [miscellaneous Crenarchaeota group-15 archaeon DG-45]|uniref:Haloacid dehalogenase n=1 Tax=miscellaneous Crenarchaeota group-15 archaeon DG-45 TaxID=1685127 RepID=A0A0M0BN01_9ARCH|nr:MAG: hypothetical protein AC482_05260 [miscellaneous Crenarchaeota group-15 archaeon DG-45]
MITTVFMDYDGTIHDYDSVLFRTFEGILGLSGREFHRIYVYDIHRAIVHTRYPEKHDDMIFHCKLLFQHLSEPFDPELAGLICQKFDDASEEAQIRPKYFPEAIAALDEMKGMGLKLCLSTGSGAERKAETLECHTGVQFFDHIFSEPKIGFLKTEPSYYRIALGWARARPEETVSIGDTPMSDIRPAKAVGITTIWVNRRGEPTPENPDQRPDFEVHDLIEAVEVLSE